MAIRTGSDWKRSSSVNEWKCGEISLSRDLVNSCMLSGSCTSRSANVAARFVPSSRGCHGSFSLRASAIFWMTSCRLSRTSQGRACV